MSQRIFVSYSHEDASLVTPVVRLLRATRDFVFLDSDTIRPGKKWREELERALGDASLVVLFWCMHSSESSEVEAEYQAAVAAEKDILPVLLDSTPLQYGLDEYQWIDFRELVGGQHAQVAEKIQCEMEVPPASRRLSWKLPALLTVAAGLAIMLTLFTMSPKKEAPPVTTITPSPMPSLETSSMQFPIIPLFWAAVLLVVIFVIGRRWKRKHAELTEGPPVQAEQMSASIQEEIRRRLAEKAA